jgi:hypothetical protein
MRSGWCLLTEKVNRRCHQPLELRGGPEGGCWLGGHGDDGPAGGEAGGSRGRERALGCVDSVGIDGGAPEGCEPGGGACHVADCAQGLG